MAPGDIAMVEPSLSGLTALVTGGSGGIGRAICVRLAQAGIKVAVNYQSNEAKALETAALVKKAGSTACTVCADVADREQVLAMVQQITDNLGPVDLLVNNAAVFDFVGHDEITPEIWKRSLDVNLTGPYNVIWAVKQGMIERRFGRIVNISSIAGIRGRPNSISYAVTKSGLNMLTKSLSDALAEYNVRINGIAPGLIDTEMPRIAASEEVMAQLVEATPMKRIGQPEDIASVVYFLLSDESRFMTGQTLVASGGRVMVP